MKRRKNIVDLE